jgi:hypothetical protein
MRKPLTLAWTSLACLGLAWACGSNSASAPPPAPDAASEGGDDAASLPDNYVIPSPDGPVTHCTLGDMTDPVKLCVEKALLQAELQYAYTSGTGVATFWDSVTSTPSGHSAADDVALANAIWHYACSAQQYGDTDLAGTLAATQQDLAKVIESELAPAPDAYDGEVYFQLRGAEAGYYFANDTTNAVKLAELADNYGRAIQTQYAHTVPVYPPVTGGDAGSEAGDAAAGGAPGDATTADGAVDAGGGSSDAGAAPGVIIGVPSGAGFEYKPAQVVTAAAALLDMAVLHAKDPDAGADPATWQATAVAALDYVWRRGRDPSTGLFYQSLVTSGDPDHDSLGMGTPTDDALLTDVQASIVLGLGRAQERFNALTSAADAGADADSLPASNYLQQADDLIAALIAAKLWDGLPSPGMDPGAFFEGLIPPAPGGSPVILTDKTTFGNAYLLAGMVRILAGSTSANGYILGHLIAAFVQQMPANTSLLTAVTDSQGRVVQQGYLRATSRDFSLSVSYSLDGGSAGLEPRASSYRTAALAEMIEGFTQRWRERVNPPPCGL